MIVFRECVLMSLIDKEPSGKLGYDYLQENFASEKAYLIIKNSISKVKYGL